MMISVKILGYKTPQRYAVRRAVLAAHDALRAQFPDLQLDVIEVRQRAEMEKYTPVVIYPSLMVNEKLVCVGRVPTRQEVVGWLKRAAEH